MERATKRRIAVPTLLLLVLVPGCLIALAVLANAAFGEEEETEQTPAPVSFELHGSDSRRVGFAILQPVDGATTMVRLRLMRVLERHRALVHRGACDRLSGRHVFTLRAARRDPGGRTSTSTTVLAVTFSAFQRPEHAIVVRDARTNAVVACGGVPR